jgi:hypothetical protein
VGVQEVRWEKGGTERAQDYTFFHGQGNGDHQVGTGFLYMRESYQRLGEWSVLVTGCHIILRVHWCNIMDLNVHAHVKIGGNDIKDSSFE